MRTINFSENSHVVRNENIERFRIEMSRYEVLSDSDLRDCIAKAHNGSQRARNAAINANLRIVWSIAAKYQGIDLFEDILGNGLEGLCVAVDTFDVSRETKFSTWALEIVRKYICIGLTNESRTVRMAAHLIKENYTTKSMDEPLANDGEDKDKTFGDTFASDSKADSFAHIEDMRVKIAYLMDGLKPIEKAVICGLFGLNGEEVSQYTLAKKYGLTEERIRQIKFEALKKMQEIG
jgi:RNA polymerase sigma factor (sigma-70 family)